MVKLGLMNENSEIILYFFKKTCILKKITIFAFLNFWNKLIEYKMKPEIHPENYRLVVFKDMSNGYTFLTKSCADTKDTIVHEDGVEYPLVKLDISMTSHPFYTGKQVLVDTAGRIDKFKTRYAKKS